MEHDRERSTNTEAERTGAAVDSDKGKIAGEGAVTIWSQ